MKIYLIILLQFYGVSLFCQVPGYKGNKLSLLFNPTIGVALADAGSHFEDVPDKNLNYRSDLSLDYVVSVSDAIGISIKYSRPMMYGATFISDVSELSGDDIVIYSGFSGDVRLNALGFGFYLKHFTFGNSGSIAPLGRYSKFEVCIVRTSGESIATREPDIYDEDQTSYVIYSLTNNLSDLSYSDEAALTAGFIYTLGRQMIYYDKLILNMSGEMGFFPHLFGEAGNLASNTYMFNEQGYIEALQTRIAGAYFINLSFGIGLLVH